MGGEDEVGDNGGGEAYLVCTMAISGLILPSSPRRAITLSCKTRPINSSPLSLGNGATLNTALVSQPIHSRTTCTHKYRGTNKAVGREEVEGRGAGGRDHSEEELLSNRLHVFFSPLLSPSPPFALHFPCRHRTD